MDRVASKIFLVLAARASRTSWRISRYRNSVTGKLLLRTSKSSGFDTPSSMSHSASWASRSAYSLTHPPCLLAERAVDQSRQRGCGLLRPCGEHCQQPLQACRDLRRRVLCTSTVHLGTALGSTAAPVHASRER